MISDDRLQEAIDFWINKEEITYKEIEVTVIYMPYDYISPYDDEKTIYIMPDAKDVAEYLYSKKDNYSIFDMNDDIPFSHPYYNELFDEFDNYFNDYIEDYQNLHPEIVDYAFNDLNLSYE